ncbi:histidine kinase N-terminal 7TM domain-containing diguanylate cyclase [Deinococcus pimensis]|uniref:histidine kinase N-terminal 7TM domain-containing diguanylate cyclase n=1 Tax=Deinococcus pimensis TaxID=309888 RepID=UPI0004865494|nr:diguanylate cyclase [Deinococcus pimensis]
MTFAFTPYALPFVPTVLLMALLAWIASRRERRLARPFMALMAALIAWTACYTLELLSPTLEGKTVWMVAKYLGGGAAPALWFAFSLVVTGNERRLRGWGAAALAALVGVTWLVVFTNPAHHLMWTDVWLVPGDPESHAGHGPFFWVYAASNYLLTTGSALLYVAHYRTRPPLFRAQAALLVLGGFAPLLGRIPEDAFGIDVIPKLDNVIFLLLVSSVLFALAVFRYAALNLVPIAHHLVIRDIGAAVVVLDVQGRVVDLNPYARTLMGSGPRGATGTRPAALLPEWPDLTDEDAAERELLLDRPDGRRWLSLHATPILAPQGGRAGTVAVLFDVTRRKLAELELERSARTDALTGLTNRRHFHELAELAEGRASRSRHSLAVIMIDIDHFKKVNDTHGHGAGDEALRHVARVCSSRVRATDVLARYGGEEFVVLLEGVGESDAALVAEELRAAVERSPVTLEHGPLPLTLSVGVALTDVSSGLDLPGCVTRADRALYASKTAGRNRVTVEHAPTLASI